MLPPSSWSLYVITDTLISGGRSHEYIAEMAFSGGADVVQLRDKNASPGELMGVAKRMKALAEGFQKIFIVNDRIDVAIGSSSHGVHLGFDDFDYACVRKALPPSMVFGATAGNEKELEKAVMARADYIGVSPVFEARRTKTDAGNPVGLKFIEKARSMTTIPLLGIGGINHENAPSVIRAGASGIAVISSVVGEEDIGGSARRLKEIVREAKVKYSSPGIE